MLKITLIALLAIVVLVLIVVAVGYVLPVGHVASGQTTVTKAPDAVFAVLSDVASFPVWRKDVSRVEILSSNPVRWREHGSQLRLRAHLGALPADREAFALSMQSG